MFLLPGGEMHLSSHLTFNHNLEHPVYDLCLLSPHSPICHIIALSNKYEVEVCTFICECVYVCVHSYPRQQALWWCGGNSFSVRPLGHAQLGRHGGRFVDIGQRLWAILRLDILRSVPLVAICVVVKVWREGEREMRVSISPHWTRPSLGSSDSQPQLCENNTALPSMFFKH